MGKMPLRLRGMRSERTLSEVEGAVEESRHSAQGA
jgi:hypothetical protein